MEEMLRVIRGGGSQVSRPRRHNPVPLLVWSSLSILTLGMIALILISLSPPSLGLLFEEYPDNRVHAFETLQMSGKYLRLDVGDGRIVPVFRAGQVGGAVILGRGSYRVDLPPEAAATFATLTGLDVLEDGIRAIYLPLDYQGLQDLKAMAGAKAVEDPTAVETARGVLARNLDDPGLLRVFGVFRRFAVGPTSLTRIEGYGYPAIYYSEGERVELVVPSLGPEGVFQLEPPEQPGGFFATPVTPPLSWPVAAGVFAIVVLLLLAAVFALTAELDPTPTHPPARRGALLAMLAILPLLEVAARSVLPPTDWSELGVYLVLAGATLYYARSAEWPLSYLGLHSRQLPRSLMAGLILGTAMVLGATLAMPRGLQVLRFPQYLSVGAWSFLVGGLLPEIYYRGLIQSALERYAGSHAAVLATAYLAAMSRAIPLMLTGVPFNAIRWVEVGLATPAAFLIAGYLYQRTRSLAGSATVLGLLHLLPRILRF
jgi:hypothetical protein